MTTPPWIRKQEPKLSLGLKIFLSFLTVVGISIFMVLGGMVGAWFWICVRTGVRFIDAGAL